MNVTAKTATGIKKFPLKSFVDPGAAGSLLSAYVAIKHGVVITKEKSRMAEAYGGRKVPLLGSCTLEVELTDSGGAVRSTPVRCDVAEDRTYGLLLGRPWLGQAKIDIDWAEKAPRWSFRKLWSSRDNGARYRDNSIVEWTTSEEMEKLRATGHTVYAVMLDELAEEEPPELRRLPAWAAHMAVVFDKEDAKAVPLNGPHDHAIELEEGKQPPWGPIYTLGGKELATLREHLDEGIELGRIRHSTSAARSPVIFVPKKDGQLRMCVDYRGLNAVTLKNRHALPLISELLDRVVGMAFFTKLDLAEAYHRIRIRHGDEWKTAFGCRYGHYEYVVMPFGLTNAPASFQAYINKCLAGLVDFCCIVFMDDILIFSRDQASHRRHVLEVLERLREYNLYAKLNKCEFEVQEVQFLGFVVRSDGVTMEPSRVESVAQWPEPESVRDLQVFLGFANFYRRFIEGYSRIAEPLTTLTAKKVPF